MAEQEGDTLALQDEDRLPWLEAVDDVDDEDSVSPLKLAAFVLAGLVLLGLVVGGVWWFQNRTTDQGDGTLIAAQEGDYKVKPDEPGGMKVEGAGDTALPTSDGADPAGKIDADALPEAPVATAKPAAPAVTPVVPPQKGSATTAVPPSGGVLKAPPPGNVPPGTKAPGSASGGSLIQLGAYASAAEANTAWNGLSKRFAWIGGLGKQVVQADVNGKTVHRLRVAAGSHGQAVDLCKRLKVAGQDCLIVAN